MADPPHRVPELSPFGHRRDLWGARLAYSSGVPIIEMVAKANISRIAQTDLVYRQAIPGEMKRVLTIIAWRMVRCSLSSMPSADVVQSRRAPFLDRTKLGRASCRARACKTGETRGVGGSVEKQTT